jgi:hypothetical protein
MLSNVAGGLVDSLFKIGGFSLQEEKQARKISLPELRS